MLSPYLMTSITFFFLSVVFEREHPKNCLSERTFPPDTICVAVCVRLKGTRWFRYIVLHQSTSKLFFFHTPHTMWLTSKKLRHSRTQSQVCKIFPTPDSARIFLYYYYFHDVYKHFLCCTEKLLVSVGSENCERRETDWVVWGKWNRKNFHIT